MNENQNEELLPTTKEALDAFVASITEQYELPPGDDTYDAIATMVLHLPHTKAHASRSYFGYGVLKMMANKAAFERLQEIKKRRDDADAAKQAEEQTKLTLVQGEPSADCGEQPLQNA